MKIAMILAACILTASAAMAQVIDPVKQGQAIAEGVNQRVDARVDQRLAQYESKSQTSNVVPAAPQYPVPPAPQVKQLANGAVDYTRYNTIVRDCAGVWTPNDAEKETNAVTLNNDTDAEFHHRKQHCLQKQTEQAERLRSQKSAPQKASRIQSGQAVVNQVEQEAAGDDDDEQAIVEKASFGRNGRSSGAGNCPRGFHFDRMERSCIRHTEVSGPSPYNVPDNVARCRVGSSRVIEVRSPTGGRRKVEQTCNRHH